MAGKKDHQVYKDIEKEVRLSRLVFDETINYELDDNCSWVADLYNELEEETDREEDGYKPGFIKVELTLKRKSEKPFGDMLLVRGHVKSDYTAACVRCLALTPQSVEVDFQCAFVNSRLENDPEYEELDDIFTENEEWDLYFYEKGNADVAEMVHEQLYMSVNQFPLHDEHCLGLCTECGTDLNTGSCKHHPRKIS